MLGLAGAVADVNLVKDVVDALAVWPPHANVSEACGEKMLRSGADNLGVNGAGVGGDEQDSVRRRKTQIGKSREIENVL